MFITPFLTSVLGFTIAEEVPDYTTMFDGGIILLGILLFNLRGRIYEKPYDTKNQL